MQQRSEANPKKAEPEISTAIHELLDRHGVPKAKRAAALKLALGVNYQAARRRLSGEVPWTPDEICRLAQQFGVPVFELLAALVDQSGQPATLQVDGRETACWLWLGRQVSACQPAGPFVACQLRPPHWSVMPTTNAIGRSPLYEVHRLVMENCQARRRIAVIEDDMELAHHIVSFLRAKGLDATAYGREDDLRAVLRTMPFDGYILDWRLDHDDARHLLPLIRAKSPVAPLILLTVPSPAAHPDDDELASLLATYRAQLYEKPTGPLSLFIALDLGFEAARRT